MAHDLLVDPEALRDHAVLLLLGVNATTVGFAAIAMLCPLMMVGMMALMGGGMMRHGRNDRGDHHTDVR